jgi:predicted RNase H-like nuclease
MGRHPAGPRWHSAGVAVLGVDGCPGGWVGLLLDGGAWSWHVGDFAAMLALGAEVVAVDIPIGLPPGPHRRAADLQARILLGPQRSSVWPVPPRVVLEAGSQAEATALSRAAGSTGVSIQLWHVLAKVAEVDEAVRAGAPAVEAHPEVSFRRLGGRPLPPKRTAAGRAERLALLRTWLPDLALPDPLPGRAKPDDCLDAAACAWTATRWLRGDAEVLGDELDALGVPMRIVV